MAKIATKSITGNELTISFVGAGTLDVNLFDMSEDMIQRLAMHGLSQKLGDSYSGALSGKDAERLAQEVYERLKKDIWASRSSTGSLAAEVLARAVGVDIATAAAKWAEMDDKTKASVKKHPSYQVARAEILAERAAATKTSTPALTLDNL